ncbi:MAG: FAD-dependent oxidoreductase [Caulobacteraceae bacterium]
MLGSGELGLETALMGPGARPGGGGGGRGAGPLARIARSAGCALCAGIPLLAGHTPRRAEGGRDGVERLALTSVHGGADIAIECDTICLAAGLAPAIELLNAAGGQIVPDGERGGHAPALDGWATSLPGVFAAGDCAGLAASEADAAEQGRQAARQALGGSSEGSPRRGADAWTYQQAWHDALTRNADPALIVCQCEAVTRGDLLEVRAPRYLGEPTAAAKGA